MDYEDGWLPTLDTSLRVNEYNVVEYKFYEKPTTSNTTIRKTSAMGENQKVQSLSNDLVRRLLNTKEDLPCGYKEVVVDDYGNKLLTSGYGREQVTRILLNGIKGYMSKRNRRKANGSLRIHRTADESKHGRIKKNLLGKSSWYKKRKEELARRVKELLVRLKPVLGYRLSVAERTGRSLQS